MFFVVAFDGYNQSLIRLIDYQVIVILQIRQTPTCHFGLDHIQGHFNRGCSLQVVCVR